MLRAMGMTVLAGILLYTLLDSRLDKYRTRRLMTTWIAAIILINVSLAALLSGQTYMHLSPLLLNLPVFALFGWLSRHRGGRMFFTLMTHIVEVALVTLTGMLCALPFGSSFVADLLGRCAAAVLLLVLNLHLRPLYLDMQETLSRGWFLFSLIPFAYYASLYFYVMRVSPRDRVEHLADILVFSCMVIAAYGVIFFFFQNIRRNAQNERERQLLQTQVSALRRQQNIMRESEEKIRLYRHDMRFTLHALTAMLERGDVAGALRYLGESDAKLTDTALIHYCKCPILDALLAYYKEQAHNRDIEMQIQMALTPDLPVDETELSTVFANALENAIHACEQLPDGETGRIKVTGVSSPHFCIEIANTCDGNIEFDSDGFPLSHEPGHGVGTRSIAAFFAKYKAVYQYSITEDGMFRLQFLINRSGGS